MVIWRPMMIGIYTYIVSDRRRHVIKIGRGKCLHSLKFGSCEFFCDKAVVCPVGRSGIAYTTYRSTYLESSGRQNLTSLHPHSTLHISRVTQSCSFHSRKFVAKRQTAQDREQCS